MSKFYGWEQTIFSVLMFREKVLLVGLSNAVMVTFFLSGINLSIFLPLNPAVYRPGNTPSVLGRRCKKKDES